MSVYNKEEAVAALSKLPTNVLIQLVRMYRESNRTSLKYSDSTSTFRICNISDDIMEEVRMYESIEDSSLGQHNKQWVTTVKRLPKNTSACRFLMITFSNTWMRCGTKRSVGWRASRKNCCRISCSICRPVSVVPLSSPVSRDAERLGS